MFLGQFRQSLAKPKEEPEVTEAPKTKSANADEFLGTLQAKQFINKWAKKKVDGAILYKKRGISRLLRAIFPNHNSDKQVLDEADMLLKMLGGMDGLTGFLMGWKAKSEGIVKVAKGIKKIVSGK